MNIKITFLLLLLTILMKILLSLLLLISTNGLIFERFSSILGRRKSKTVGCNMMFDSNYNNTSYYKDIQASLNQDFRSDSVILPYITIIHN